ncbi:MAG: hypothetical protein NZM44_00920 [Candidatus Calescibacterium sp.]|nr:hypothetical protein [Candidatus Calescibacterium sp.]
MNNKKTIIIVAAVVILLAAAVGIFLYIRSKKKKNELNIKISSKEGSNIPSLGNESGESNLDEVNKHENLMRAFQIYKEETGSDVPQWILDNLEENIKNKRFKDDPSLKGSLVGSFIGTLAINKNENNPEFEKALPKLWKFLYELQNKDSKRRLTKQ